MGAALSVSTVDATQKITNTTYQKAQNACTATCNQLISGNVIVLDNTKAGDITFTQRCVGDASCYMNNALEQVVDVYQELEAEAKASPSLFPGIQVNISDTTTNQEIRTELTQIMENLCTADVNQTVQDNIIYATDSEVQNIGFLQEGNAAARCVMENAGRLQLQVQQKGKATASAGGGASFIAAIIMAVIVVVIVIAVIRAMRKKTPDCGMDPTGQPIQAGPDGQCPLPPPPTNAQGKPLQGGRTATRSSRTGGGRSGGFAQQFKGIASQFGGKK